MVATSLLIILTHAPHGSAWTREGLDVALVAASLDQPVTLMLSGDGVYVALKGQQAGALGQKGTLPMLEGLEMYDIAPIYVDCTALKERGLVCDDLIESSVLCDASELLTHHTNVLVF